MIHVTFFNERELDEVDKDIKVILDRSKFRGLIDGPDDTRKVIESFRKIKNSIDILVVSARSGLLVLHVQDLCVRVNLRCEQR